MKTPQLNTISYDDLSQMDAYSVRKNIRSNNYIGHTAGLANGKLQANLVILPEKYALGFIRFCQRNPKPCPLTGISDTGIPQMHTLGPDIDIRSDVPAYNIYKNGILESCVTDIYDLWQEDFVAFALGCSFTFEHAVIQAGINLWHIDNNKTVPMYQTNIPMRATGNFSGGTVVSMRSIPDKKIDLVTKISRKYLLAHGVPIHIGDPVEIGISDISTPDWGDLAPIAAGETPMFWACGVTSQVILANANIPLFITHKPGSMLITDIDKFAETPFHG